MNLLSRWVWYHTVTCLLGSCFFTFVCCVQASCTPHTPAPRSMGSADSKMYVWVTKCRSVFLSEPVTQFLCPELLMLSTYIDVVQLRRCGCAFSWFVIVYVYKQLFLPGAGNTAFSPSTSIEKQVASQNNQEWDHFLSQRSRVSRNVHVHDVYVREKEILRVCAWMKIAFVTNHKEMK